MEEDDTDVAPAHQNKNRTRSRAATGQIFKLKMAGAPARAGMAAAAMRGVPVLQVAARRRRSAGTAQTPAPAALRRMLEPLNAPSRFWCEQNHVADPREHTRENCSLTVPR